MVPHVFHMHGMPTLLEFKDPFPDANSQGANQTAQSLISSMTIDASDLCESTTASLAEACTFPVVGGLQEGTTFTTSTRETATFLCINNLSARAPNLLVRAPHAEPNFFNLSNLSKSPNFSFVLLYLADRQLQLA